VSKIRARKLSETADFRMIIMKTVNVLLLFILYSLNTSAKIFNVKIVCKETEEPIAYCNIGIVGENIGTASDADGKFSIYFNDTVKNEIIKISSIGYHSLEMRMNDFLALYKNGSVIYLKKEVADLQEVIIKPKTITHKHLGVLTKNPFPGLTFDTCLPGYETGVLMETKKDLTFIDSVQINIAQCETDSIFFRINIYKYVNKEFINILDSAIYVCEPTSKIKDRRLRINLSGRNITVTQKFMVSVEILKSMGRHQLYFSGALTNKGYSRKTSQGNWKNEKVASAISAYVSY